MLVVLESAGGELDLRLLRQRLGLSKANASEVTSTLEQRGLITRRTEPARPPGADDQPHAAGRAPWSTTCSRITPAASATPSPSLDDGEKRELARLCRKLERAA